jgi:hypothetical protein
LIKQQQKTRIQNKILLIKQQQKTRIQLSRTGSGKKDITVTTFGVTSCQTTTL